jgi:tetratricopeptide (TPR) repeat protein
MALRLGDKHSELLTRIGCGIVARQIGNLPESEKILGKVIAESSTFGDRDAEARACQDLAGTLYYASRIAAAAPLAFRAFELYESPTDKARALSDTGAMLKELGHYNAAKNAFAIVLSKELTNDVRARTELECIEVSALVGDRISFERWRHAVAEKREQLPPDIQLDFELAVGTGLSLFDEHERGEAHIQQAIAIAEQLGMAERVFYAERQLAEARDRRAMPIAFSEVPATDADRSLGVQGTIERLEVLATTERG